MDCLPQELQRHISQLREIDFKTRGKHVEHVNVTITFCLEFESQLNTMVGVLDGAVKSGCITEQQNVLHKLTKLMLIFREAGDDKSEITSQMLDNVRSSVTCLVGVTSRFADRGTSSTASVESQRAGYATPT